MTDVNRQLLLAFRAAFTSWELDLSEAGYLIGVEEATVREFLSAETIDVSEEVVARVVMVAQIRTALDLCWSPSLSREWMKLPNGGDPYNGASPLEYVKGHGWPGLFWILRQVQAWAVGNF
ncbi:MAG: hypothetical protein WBQ94_30640 [Terracidiphilus sp.]